MASIWKISSTDVYVDDYDTDSDVNMSEHVPLDATTSSVLHFFGSGPGTVNISGNIFTKAIHDTLQGYADNNTTITLTSDQGSEGSFKIENFSAKRVNVVSVQIPGVASDAIRYTFKMKLKKVT